MSNVDKLKAQIKRHEGLRLNPYRDTTGVKTIGYGHNLDANGISQLVAEIIFDEDFATAVQGAASLPEFAVLDDVRRCVLIEMVFNMGLTTVKKFANTLAAMGRGDYEAAARGMLSSKWARQVGRRAEVLAEMMRTGKFGG